MVQAHRDNVSGDFYIEDGCCISCGVPENEAPHMFGWRDDHCYLKQQPTCAQDDYLMIEVMTFAEVDCLRYRGRDSIFLVRMAQAGLLGQADYSAGVAEPMQLRDHVCFEGCNDDALPPLAIAIDFKSHLLRAGVNANLTI